MSKSATILLTNVRFSYVNVFEPRAATEGATPRYSCCLLLPKPDASKYSEKVNKELAAQLETVKKALSQVFQDNAAEKFKGLKISQVKMPLRDGDAEDKGDSYVGMYFINASNSKRPGVVDVNVKPIIDPSEFYSGCWGRAQVNLFAYNTAGNRGISCALNHVQKIRDDDPLGAGGTAEQAFGGANAYTREDDMSFLD